MPTILPRDMSDQPIPALRLKAGGGHAISATGTAARNSSGFAADTRVVSVYSTVAVYLKFGGNTVTATSADHYFPAGVYYDFAVGGDNTGHYTHVSALAVGGNGSVYVSEKE